MVAKENQKTTSDFDALDPRERGCSPLSDPKEVGCVQKSWRFAHPREDLLTAFLSSADEKPLRGNRVPPQRTVLGETPGLLVG